MTEKLAIGVDVGGTNTVTGLVDTEGKTHGERSFKTREYPYFEDYVERLVQDIESLRRIAPGTELAGIGIGVPNGNYFSGVAENPINIRWYERNRDGSQGAQILTIPFVETVKKHYPSLPVVIDNDANAAAIGEMIYGGARGMRDFIEITLGTGLGGGIVANGEMVYGYGGTAGELGHITVRPGGRLCGCGRRGCLETYVSATGIVRTMLEILADDTRPSRLRSVPVEKIDSKMIAEAALDGDELARAAFEETGRILGESLANFVAFSFPEAIFLFGGLAKSGNLLWEPTKRHMGTNMLRNYKGMVKLLPSGIDRANAAILRRIGTGMERAAETRTQINPACGTPRHPRSRVRLSWPTGFAFLCRQHPAMRPISSRPANAGCRGDTHRPPLSGFGKPPDTAPAISGQGPHTNGHAIFDSNRTWNTNPAFSPSGNIPNTHGRP